MEIPFLTSYLCSVRRPFDGFNMNCWAPKTSTAFLTLLSARYCSALWSNISDCDETYNYWEPASILKVKLKCTNVHVQKKWWRTKCVSTNCCNFRHTILYMVQDFKPGSIRQNMPFDRIRIFSYILYLACGRNVFMALEIRYGKTIECRLLCKHINCFTCVSILQL